MVQAPALETVNIYIALTRVCSSILLNNGKRPKIFKYFGVIALCFYVHEVLCRYIFLNTK